jgi:hypothetical protein
MINPGEFFRGPLGTHKDSFSHKIYTVLLDIILGPNFEKAKSKE